MLPPYAESAAQLMAQITSLPLRHDYARIVHNPYVDDEAIESDDLDD